MKNKRILFLGMILLMIIFSSSINYATSSGKKKCTHAVYSTNNTSTYHYYYCSVCGKCNGRASHSVSSTSNYRKQFVS